MTDIYFVSTYKFFKYTEDYIGSIKTVMSVKYILYNKETELDKIVFDPKAVYIFCQEIPKSVFDEINNKIILNMEQLTRNKFMEQIKNYVNNKIPLIDYAQENMKMIEYQKYDHIPYQYNKLEFLKLKEYLNTEKKYDIAFSGSVGHRRNKIITELKNKGVSVYVVQGWGDERDKEIGKCRILLNVHYGDDYGIYEHMRCDRWTFSGMLVISENTVENRMLDIKDLVVFDSYKDLVNKTVDVVKNYEKYYSIFIKNYNKQYKEILHNRKMKLLDFKKKIDLINICV